MTQWFQTLDNSQHRTVVPERSGEKNKVSPLVASAY